MTDAPHRYDVHIEVWHWPKCYLCSRALAQNYPVEYFGVVWRESPRSLGIAYDLIIEVKCTHGEQERRRLDKIMTAKEMRANDALLDMAKAQSSTPVYGAMNCQRIRVEIPRRWVGQREDVAVRGSATELVALSRIYAFAPGKRGENGVVYMPGDIGRRHGLETGVR